MNDHKFRILSLDGGGVRGYLSARILEQIENHLNRKDGKNIPLGKRFDLLVGTSTGAIIAGLLAIGKRAKEVREIYEKDINSIFSKEMKRNFLLSLFFPKYRPDKLIKKANDHFQGKTFMDVDTDLVITTVDIDNMKPRMYKSDFSINYTDRADEKLADAIVASASAPVYFPVARDLQHSDYLVDGGVVANNPSMVGITDALTFTRNSKRGTPKPTGLHDILLLSIGTGDQVQRPYDLKPLLNAGAIDWLVQPPLGMYEKSSPLIELLMASQARLVDFQVKTLLKASSGTYRRINPKLSSKMQLDDINSIGRLKNIADLQSEDYEWLNEHLVGGE